MNPMLNMSYDLDASGRRMGLCSDKQFALRVAKKATLGVTGAVAFGYVLSIISITPKILAIQYIAAAALAILAINFCVTVAANGLHKKGLLSERSATKLHLLSKWFVVSSIAIRVATVQMGLFSTLGPPTLLIIATYIILKKLKNADRLPESPALYALADQAHAEALRDRIQADVDAQNLQNIEAEPSFGVFVARARAAVTNSASIAAASKARADATAIAAGRAISADLITAASRAATPPGGIPGT